MPTPISRAGWDQPPNPLEKERVVSITVWAQWAGGKIFEK
jgi:hypothetical protein